MNREDWHYTKDDVKPGKTQTFFTKEAIGRRLIASEQLKEGRGAESSASPKKATEARAA